MAQPSGRPKSRNPRDVKITVRFTEEEADALQRLVAFDGQPSLSLLLRKALEAYLAQRLRTGPLPDTKEAHLAREVRKAKRAGPPDPTVLAAFTLEEDLGEAPSPPSVP